MLLLLMLLINRASATDFASSPKGCGRYVVAGVIHKNKGFGVTLVVNEKSQSEYRFKPASGELPRFVAILDLPVSLELSIVKLNGMSGEVAGAHEMSLIAPQPLEQHKSSGFKLIEEKPCEK